MEVGAGTFHTATFLRAIGPGALERRLRAALAPPDRRALRRQPVPPAALLPVPGGDQTLAAGHPRSVPGEPRGAGLRSAGARHPLRRGQLGIADAGRLGPGLGGVAERHGDHAVHLLPAGRRTRLPAGDRRDHLRARAPGDVPAGRREHLRHRLDRGPARARHLPRRVPPERGRAVGLQLRARRRRAVLFRHFDDHERLLQRSCWTPGWRCPPTSRCSRPRTPSTCWMRAAPSRSPSASATSCACARSRARVAQAYYASREALGFPLLQHAGAPSPRRAHERSQRTRDFLFEIGTEELPPQGAAEPCSRRCVSAACAPGSTRPSCAHGELHRLCDAAAPGRAGEAPGRAPAGAAPCKRRGPPVTRRLRRRRQPDPGGAGLRRQLRRGSWPQLDASCDEARARSSASPAPAPGARAVSLLPGIVQDALDALPIPRRMRWGAGSALFVRPVHWLVMLFGQDVVPATLLDTPAGHAAPTAIASMRRKRAAHRARRPATSSTLRERGRVHRRFRGAPRAHPRAGHGRSPTRLGGRALIERGAARRSHRAGRMAGGHRRAASRSASWRCRARC